MKAAIARKRPIAVSKASGFSRNFDGTVKQIGEGDPLRSDRALAALRTD
jgi:hypothetical protein